MNGSKQRIKVTSDSKPIQRIGCGKLYEGRIAYVGCVSHCKFCYAQAYAWPERARRYARSKYYTSEELAEQVIDAINRDSFCWIRITGGEPLLDEERINHLTSFLQNLSRIDTGSFGSRIILQTSGVTVGRKKNLVEYLEKLSKLDLLFLIEVSFKGTNQQECKILTDNKIEFLSQVNGYWNLNDLSSEVSNTSLRARVGIGPSEPKGGDPAYEFVCPQEEEYMFTKTAWSREFRRIYENELLKPGKYMAMECLNTPKQGGIDIAMVYKRVISSLKEANILKEVLEVPSPQYENLMGNASAPFHRMSPLLYNEEFTAMHAHVNEEGE